MKRLLLLLPVLLVVLVACGGKEEYKQNSKIVADDILEDATGIDFILDEYASIWSISIKNGSPVEVEVMSMQTGYSPEEVSEIFELNTAGNVPGDFSKNVNSLKLFFDEEGVLGEVRDRAERIKDKVSDLNKPPKGYEQVYEELLELYDLSESYKEMALDPSGSLQTFNEDRKSIRDEITSKHKRIEVVMPN